MEKYLINVSKFLSLVLRHKPEAIGLTLDEGGWASVAELIARAREAGQNLTLELITDVVAQNDKQRFAISPDGQRIRANQGHSVPVQLGLTPLEPPQWLYHGTATRFLEAILRDGLRKGRRQHVHLSADPETAQRVGQRHGAPLILQVSAGRMQQSGFLFYRSDNGVWLTEQVPPDYLQVVEA